MAKNKAHKNSIIQNDQDTERFNELRLQQITDSLPSVERTELDDMMQARLQEAENFLAPAVERMRQEQQQLRQRLTRYQTESEALAQLLLQQEQLVADAGRWLQEFDRRNQNIQQTYTYLGLTIK